MLILILAAMAWNISGQEDVRFVGNLVKDGLVKVSDFVRERVQEERRVRAGVIRAGRERAGVWV